MDPIRSSEIIKGSESTEKSNKINISDNKTVEIKNLSSIMHSNLIFDNRTKPWYDSFNRYGWINMMDTDQPMREYLFFTRPDLYIFDCNGNYNNLQLNKSLAKVPFFVDTMRHHKETLVELQYHARNRNNDNDPFMHYLTNHIISKLDLPTISSDSIKSTQNIYSLTIDYRSHSLKSDHSFDFAISFKDTAYLDIYLMVKAYDEYMRMSRLGEIDLDLDSNNNTTASYYKQYIINHIIPEQFSIYKFIVGSDGETILYYAKLTGVYFTDVPRSEFGDPPNDGFKYSVSFHANIVEDMNPIILAEFDALSLASTYTKDFIPVFNPETGTINNEPAKYARVIYVTDDQRSLRHGASIHYGEYRLKWTNIRKSDARSMQQKLSENYIRALHFAQQNNGYNNANNAWNSAGQSILYNNNKSITNIGNVTSVTANTNISLKGSD